ncbi:MAG TPA: RNA polymerase sigma factor [Thermoanaerobaculia bacterium]|nr:RNA polymerase sigma factor [Thermoanaerobaculia bacterium]
MILSDAELLARTAAGDREALEGLVSRHEAAVFRFARAVTGDHAAAEDVLQETFVSVWKHAGSFRGAESARGWILIIARNAAHRQFRRHAGEPESFQPLADLGAEAGWAAHDPRLPERLADRQLVEMGFRDLAPEEREILILREVEGFSGDEVAGMLGLSVAAMKSRLHRARLRFLANVREKTNV